MGSALLLSVVVYILLVSVRSNLDKVKTEEGDLPKDIYSSEVWTWRCEERGCQKVKIQESGESCGLHGQTCVSSNVFSPPVSLPVCKLLCPPGVLWPKPTGHTNLSSNLIPVNPNSVYFKTEFVNSKTDGNEKVKELVNKAGKLFIEQLEKQSKGVAPRTLGKNLSITLKFENPSVYKYVQDADESYELYVSKNDDGGINVTISANNYLGGRHGLETLGQIIVYDTFSGAFLMPSEVKIADKPVYPYRGILLDTARNFISVASIKKVLDAMAMNKLNSFHWHITDSHSFPFSSATYPLLTKYGAYSPEKVYSESDIKELVEYARVRGIRIIPEFDAPAHVGEGWQWVKDNATVCFKADPWTQYCVEPPCGQLNPTSENVYTILEGIYKDMNAVFDSDIFHMGGDEVNFNCWNTSEPVVENMEKMNLGRKEKDFVSLWNTFQSRALNVLEKVNDKAKKVTLWTSTLTEKGLDKLDNSKYIIQIWTKGHDPAIKHILEKGFPVIFSNYEALYLDCGFGAWIGSGNNWCSPYIPWQKVYENDPELLVNNLKVNCSKNLILGSEATLWTEQADDASIENRLWPRAAAMAEALWSGHNNWGSAETRLLHHRNRMVERGIHADSIEPDWCYQNGGRCYA